MLETRSKFEGWYQFSSLVIERFNYESIAYVGDLHGSDDMLIDRLNGLAIRGRPDHLILTGDLAGSDEDVRFKRLYYETFNPLKPVLDGNRDLSDESLAGYQVPNSEDRLRDRYLVLEAYKLELEGIDKDEIDRRIAGLTDKEVADGLRGIYNPPSIRFYGTWAASLHPQVRRAVLETVSKSVVDLAPHLDRLQEVGTKIHVVEGNWDPVDRGGFFEISGGDVPVFDALKFLERRGVDIHRSVGAFETDNTLHMMWPIYPLMDGRVTEAELNELEKAAKIARGKGKAILHVAHVEPDWRVHFLDNPGYDHANEYRTSGENLRSCLARFGSGEIIYGHQHNPRKDEEGKPIDPNEKYFLGIRDDGIEKSAELVWDIKDLRRYHESILATYLPLRQFAYSCISREYFRRELIVHGGKRNSAWVVLNSYE